MELGTFAPRERDDINGDKLQAKEAVDKPLIALVREHRTGIKTKFNQNPADKGYKADGQDGVTVDVANVTTDEIYIDVLWLNGSIVDNLVPFLGQAVPIKLAWTPNQGGGNPYISVKPLEGAELAVAQQWAARNSNRFETERAQRAAQSKSNGFKEGDPAQAPAFAQPAAQTPAAVPVVTPADPNDPAVAALLAQLGAQQVAAG